MILFKKKRGGKMDAHKLPEVHLLLQNQKIKTLT